MKTIPPILTLGLFETYVPVKHLEASIAFYGEK